MIDSAITALVQYAVRAGLLEACDETWAVNTLLGILKLSAYDPAAPAEAAPLHELLNTFTDDAVRRGVIEDGIASAAQRASLEYADAVLIGWPETDSPEVADLDDAQLKIVREHMELMEGYIGKYSQMEHDGDLDGMTDTLIRITERVAEVRRLYQPDFPLPTFAEIRRVVQDEWDEDMGKIDPREDNPTAGEIEEETESADDAAGEGDQA